MAYLNLCVIVIVCIVIYKLIPCLGRVFLFLYNTTNNKECKVMNKRTIVEYHLQTLKDTYVEMHNWVNSGGSVSTISDDYGLEKTDLMTLLEMSMNQPDLKTENHNLKIEHRQLQKDWLEERSINEKYAKRLKEYEDLWYNRLYVYLRSIRIRNPFFVK